MIDDMVDHLATIADGRVWTPMPGRLRDELRSPLPREGAGADEAYAAFRRLVQPYATGNLHPAFMGWVHGGGNPVGMLAELLAGALNANLGGRDHAPVEVERDLAELLEPRDEVVVEDAEVRERLRLRRAVLLLQRRSAAHSIGT